MSDNMVLTVGSVLRGDDAAGPMLAKMMENDPVADWEVIDGQQMPEDDIGYIRRNHPERLLLVDAADMKLPVGEVRKISRDDVAYSFLMSTHSLPISILLTELEDACGEVMFLGIQPGQTEFYEPLTPQVLQAVEDIYTCIKAGGDFERYQYVGEEMRQ
jgi:hydrogenase 3 maturation protease